MSTQAVARQTETPSIDEFAEWKPVLILRCRLTVDIPLPGFTVRDLLNLAPKSVIASKWPIAASLPLRVNGELIAWSDFEAVGKHLAIRLTELA